MDGATDKIRITKLEKDEARMNDIILYKRR